MLVAGGFAVYLAIDAPAPPPASIGEVTRAQRTLLLQVQGPNGAGAANALLAHDPASKAGAVVLVPPQVLVTVPSAGSLPFGRALVTVPPQGSRAALSDLMGVTVDDGWILDGPTFSALADAVGGVPVDVDVQLVQANTVLLSPGQQNLSGPQALAFMTYLAQGEQEQARLARLGKRSVTTAALPDLAAFLIGLAADDEAGDLQYDVLPVVDLDPGGNVTVFRADTAAVSVLVDRLLAASVPAGARQGGNRVLVLNGVGTPGLGDRVRAKLVPAGFVFVGSDNAPRFGYTTTQILVPEATPAGQALGERVAKALGLPGAKIGTQQFGSTADVIVVVGSDFTS